MRVMRHVFLTSTLFCAVSSYAAPLSVCVFDLMGAGGDTMARAKDYALAAKNWGLDIEPKVYTKINHAIADFDSKNVMVWLRIILTQKI